MTTPTPTPTPSTPAPPPAPHPTLLQRALFGFDPFAGSSADKQQTAAQKLIQTALKGYSGKIPPTLVSYVQQALDAGVPAQQIVAKIQQAAGYNPTANASAGIDQVFGKNQPKPTPQQTTNEPQPTDIFAFTHQMLQAVLSTAPRQNDPSSWNGASSFTEAYQAWLPVYEQALQNAASARQLEVGTIDLGNGHTISMEMFNQLSPQEQQMVQTQVQQRNAELLQSVQKLNNDLGLQQFNAGLNAKAQGLDSARFVEDTLEKASQWASPQGKSAFTANDFGLGNAARYAGLAPDSNFLQFSGTRDVNPGAIINAADANMGVGGALNPPQLTPYQAPPLMPVPMPTAPPAGAVPPPPGTAPAPTVPTVPQLPMPARQWGFQQA